MALMTPIELKNYKVMKAGKRGYVITLPAEFIRPNGIKPKDTVKLYLMKEDKTMLLLKVGE